MNRKVIIGCVLGLVIGVAVGRLSTPSEHPTMQEMAGGEHAGHEMPAVPERWTCSMHPQFQLPKEGSCPMCGMDLIPVETEHDHAAEVKEPERWTCSMHPQFQLPNEGSCPMCGMDLIPVKTEHDHAPETEEPDVWTCSMHPQIQLPEPGQCPICGMDLIPVKKERHGSKGGSARRLSISDEAVAIAEIETVPVRRMLVSREVRMVGKVDYDETRMRSIAAWVPGRIDRLFVDYTGVEVRKGDHLVSLYSPELRTAQEELLQAIRASGDLKKSGVAVLRESTRATIESAREKLRLLGLTQGQIRAIEKRGSATDHLTIYAPVAGTVVHKNAVEGVYVNTGSPIYKIADLSKVWVRLDAYESDMSWIRFGQDVEFTTEAYPGERFHGRIAFIDPTLNPKTRTVKIRVNVDNPDGRLKPEMFVRAVVRAGVAQGGRVMDPTLEGKWISPMHPEIVRDEPGPCPVCGMALVKAEDLGYAAADESNAPLVIPASAPLVTGERAVVYVRVPDKKRPTFEGREIELGPRTGEHYVVQSGLHAGEDVVVKGNFNLDSSLQIQARPSMMSAEGGGAAAGAHQH